MIATNLTLCRVFRCDGWLRWASGANVGGVGPEEGLVEEVDPLACQVEVGSLSQRVKQLGWVEIVVRHRRPLSCPAMDRSRLLR